MANHPLKFGTPARRSPRPDFLARASEASLMATSIGRLAVSLADCPFQNAMAKFFNELAATGLNQFKPQLYLGDEWFSPDGLLAISIPFYLAHPRLMALEKRLMGTCEGGTEASFLKLLRHEAGHCFDHAYHVSERPEWRRVFGDPNQPYRPRYYQPKPFSHGYVRHLPHFYAQSHPDEDFAETFAVWMTPGLDWRQCYKNRPKALEKLQLVDTYVRRARFMAPKAESDLLPCAASRMRRTLGDYYKKRVKEEAADHPAYFDGEIRALFRRRSPLGQATSAAEVLLGCKRILIRETNAQNGTPKWQVERLVNHLVRRSAALNLTCGEFDRQAFNRLQAWMTKTLHQFEAEGTFIRS